LTFNKLKAFLFLS